MATKGFTKIDNSVMFDKDISLEALGLYIKIKYYACIEGFKINREHIKAVSGLGETAFRRVWKELKDKCLLVQTKERNKGKYEYTYELKSNENKKDSTPKKEKPSKPVAVDGQIHIEEVIDSEEQHEEDNEVTTKNILALVDETGLGSKEANELLKAANNDVSKVISCYRYALSQKNVKNIFSYTKWAIKNNFKEGDAIRNNRVSVFNNFQQRVYDFDKLERAFLYGEEYQLPI